MSWPNELEPLSAQVIAPSPAITRSNEPSQPVTTKENVNESNWTASVIVPLENEQIAVNIDQSTSQPSRSVSVDSESGPMKMIRITGVQARPVEEDEEEDEDEVEENKEIEEDPVEKGRVEEERIEDDE